MKKTNGEFDFGFAVFFAWTSRLHSKKRLATYERQHANEAVINHFKTTSTASRLWLNLRLETSVNDQRTWSAFQGNLLSSISSGGIAVILKLKLWGATTSCAKFLCSTPSNTTDVAIFNDLSY